MAEDGEVLRGVAVPGAVVVLVEGDVEDPVEAVLDAPVAADDAGEVSGVGRQAGEVVASLRRDRVTDAAGRLDADDALEVGPGVVRVDVGEVVRIANGPTAAVLDAPVSL